MALTRKFLEDLGVAADQIDAIIGEHTATVTRINSELAETKTTLQSTQKDLDDLKAGDWQNKFEAEHTAHEALQTEVNAAKTKTAKTAALKKYFEGKKITGASLNVALRGTDYGKIDLDDNGDIVDTAALDALVSGDYAVLVSTDDQVVTTGGRVGDNGGQSANNYDFAAALRQKYK